MPYNPNRLGKMPRFLLSAGVLISMSAPTLAVSLEDDEWPTNIHDIPTHEETRSRETSRVENYHWIPEIPRPYDSPCPAPFPDDPFPKPRRVNDAFARHH